MNTNENQYSKYDQKGDNDIKWQQECLKKISDKSNVILSSPTGSGKTRVFLEWALKQYERPIIITAPIKALSNQRYRELLQAGYTVGLETGDIKNVPENCDFICCTQEIYTNKYCDLINVTLIMDEFHYIFENASRARTYIDALNKSKASNILLCSATLGDIDRLKEYVEKVSKRDFYTYENKSRLTSLSYKGDIEAEEIRDSLIVTFSRRNIEFVLEQLSNQREEQSDEKIGKITQMAENDKIENEEIIEDAKLGIAGYYGALLPKEKMFIEKCFEEGLIDTVVGTDALALGVNFPVQNVIFTQLSKYYDGPISKNLFEQLAGRAGRKGYFDEGYVYYCSEFASELEANGYDTEDLFDMILKKENEDVKISLTANIKDILLGKTTIIEEAEYMSEFSTEQADTKRIIEVLSDVIQYIKNEAFREEVRQMVDNRYNYQGEHWDEKLEKYVKNRTEDEREKFQEKLMAKEGEFRQNIAKVYFDEYTPEENCRIFADIVCGTNPDVILRRYGISENFYNMLQFRKYVKSLPKEYRKGLTKINDIIREIDETAIDGYRGSVSTKDIGEQLREESRLTGKNIKQILHEQEAIKRMSEKAEIIEEQLKIAEEYGLEEYK